VYAYGSTLWPYSNSKEKNPACSMLIAIMLLDVIAASRAPKVGHTFYNPHFEVARLALKPERLQHRRRVEIGLPWW
jgi:hypothetical protein